MEQISKIQRPSKKFLATFLYRHLKDSFVPVQRLPSDPILIDPDELRIWAIGHATVLINLFGTTIITDPVLVRGIPFPFRRIAQGYSAKELPPIDYVVVSHAHLDHCNKPTLRQLAPKTKTIILPRHCNDIVTGMGFQKVVELDWGNTLMDKEIGITAYKVKHWGQRVPWEKIDRGYNGYVFEKKLGAVFFGGDTGYGDFFKKIGKNHLIDVALLPISAYNPPSFRHHHMNPEDALVAARDLGARHIIPIHWGNFRLSLESLSEPPEMFSRLAKEMKMESRAHVLENGKSFALS